VQHLRGSQPDATERIDPEAVICLRTRSCIVGPTRLFVGPGPYLEHNLPAILESEKIPHAYPLDPFVNEVRQGYDMHLQKTGT